MLKNEYFFLTVIKSVRTNDDGDEVDKRKEDKNDDTQLRPSNESIEDVDNHQQVIPVVIRYQVDLARRQQSNYRAKLTDHEPTDRQQ